MTEVAVEQRASSEGIRSPEMPMVKVAVVEAVVAALARGETVLAVARAYDLDPKTVRSWRQRGQYRARRPEGTAGGASGGLTAGAAGVSTSMSSVARRAPCPIREADTVDGPADGPTGGRRVTCSSCSSVPVASPNARGASAQRSVCPRRASVVSSPTRSSTAKASLTVLRLNSVAASSSRTEYRTCGAAAGSGIGPDARAISRSTARGAAIPFPATSDRWRIMRANDQSTRTTPGAGSQTTSAMRSGVPRSPTVCTTPL